jgi:hypothetical protein
MKVWVGSFHMKPLENDDTARLEKAIRRIIDRINRMKKRIESLVH